MRLLLEGLFHYYKISSPSPRTRSGRLENKHPTSPCDHLALLSTSHAPVGCQSPCCTAPSSNHTPRRSSFFLTCLNVPFPSTLSAFSRNAVIRLDELMIGGGGISSALLLFLIGEGDSGGVGLVYYRCNSSAYTPNTSFSSASS